MAHAGYCEDCGCRTYGGACVNCHEEIFIDEQYESLGMPSPPAISDRAIDQAAEIARKHKL